MNAPPRLAQRARDAIAANYAARRMAIEHPDDLLTLAAVEAACKETREVRQLLGEYLVRSDVKERV